MKKRTDIPLGKLSVTASSVSVARNLICEVCCLTVRSYLCVLDYAEL